MISVRTSSPFFFRTPMGLPEEIQPRIEMGRAFDANDVAEHFIGETSSARVPFFKHEAVLQSTFRGTSYGEINVRPRDVHAMHLLRRKGIEKSELILRHTRTQH